MNVYANADRPKTEAKKKYELSSKRGKHESFPESESTDFQSETADSSNSQNFMLRVSDSFVVEDTQENVQEKASWKGKNLTADEVIIISDSSEDEKSHRYEWTRLKTSAFMGETMESMKFSPTEIKAIASKWEDENVRKSRGAWKKDKSSNRVFAKDPPKKCSIAYTSDDSDSDTNSKNFYNNKENISKSPAKSKLAREIIPDSDDSIFSFDRMKGVLNENNRNIEAARSPIKVKKTSEIMQEFKRTPINDRKLKENESSGKSSRERKLRVEEWRKTPESLKKPSNVTGSPNNFKETTPRILETRKFRDFSKNETGSLNNLKSTNVRYEETLRTPEFSKTTITQTGSLNNLKEINKRLDSEKLSEFKKTSKKDTGSLKNYEDTRRRNEETPVNSISSKISSRTATLSNKDVRNILKVINSKRAVYQSPRDYQKAENSDDSKIDESEDEKSVSSPDSKNNRKINNPVVISETDSDSEEQIIRGSKVNLSKPYKTHVTRFLDPTANYESPDGLSERKKLEIAHWLMTNTPDTRSESSTSIVSASNKNSPSSGNSSLERLEMNFETPNNRDKLRKTNPPNSTKSTKSRQTTIDNFVRETEDGTRKIFTPVAPITRKKKIPEAPRVPENLEIMDCADILDNLYGDAWRSKAEDLLPMTEPRKKNIVLRDKGVQTERKVNRKKAVTKSSDASSPDEGFNTFVKNLQPNLNSTKKGGAKSSRRRCTFIKDSSSSSASDSGGETTYLTALTNPRISNDAKIKNGPAPLSLNIQRAIAICDSDTEDENEKGPNNRKVLTFSDDESDTSTSEYDPNDVIPAKATTKNHAGFTNTKNQTKNTRTPISAANVRIPKPKTNFLESLSSTVPIAEVHPDAKKYRQDYKNTKEELSKYLYKLYNEKIFDNKLPSDMSIEWNVRMRGTAGFCYNKRSVKALGGVTRSSRIVLATKILDKPDRLRDTLVHEMCHAAAWLINDVSDGHGPFWKGWASKAMRAFPELPPIKRCHDYKITTKFTYRCTGCGYSVGRHSKSLDTERKRCGHCYGKFELLINKVTKTGEIQSKTPVAKKPTGFALFVKENYSTVKKDRKGVPHKEVMQILGQQFSAIKISKKNNNSDENNPVDVSDD